MSIIGISLEDRLHFPSLIKLYNKIFCFVFFLLLLLSIVVVSITINKIIIIITCVYVEYIILQFQYISSYYK